MNGTLRWYTSLRAAKKHGPRHGGQLVLRTTYTCYSVPVMDILFYPLDARIRFDDAVGLFGKAVDRSSSGGYYLRSNDYPMASLDARQIHLKSGGSTLPVASIKKPIPCPKVRKGTETRWSGYYWQKLLKKGWVSI